MSVPDIGKPTETPSSGFPDRSRTTREHAGETIEDGSNVPGLVLCVLAVIAEALALTAAGYGFPARAWIAAGVGLGLGLLGTIWLVAEHRRVKARDGLRLLDQRGH